MRDAGLGAVVAAALVGGGITAVAAGQPWLHGPAAGIGAGSAGRAAVSGSVAVPLSLAAGLVGLAGAGALLAVAGRARRAVGVLLAVLAAAGVVATLLAVVRPSATYRAASTGGTAGGASLTAWPFIALAGLLLLVAAAVRTVVAGGTWATLGRRYERAPLAAGGGRPPAPARRPGPAADWDALDAGRDPTSEDDPAHAPTGGSPGGDPAGTPIDADPAGVGPTGGDHRAGGGTGRTGPGRAEHAVSDSVPPIGGVDATPPTPDRPEVGTRTGREQR